MRGGSPAVEKNSSCHSEKLKNRGEAAAFLLTSFSNGAQNAGMHECLVKLIFNRAHLNGVLCCISILVEVFAVFTRFFLTTCFYLIVLKLTKQVLFFCYCSTYSPLKANPRELDHAVD